MTAPPRLRRDPRDPASARVRLPVAAPAAAVAPSLIARVEDTAPFVLAIADLDAGRLARDDRDLLGAARRLADDLGGGTAVAVFLTPDGDLRAGLEKEGADRVTIFRNQIFADGTAEPRVVSVLAAADACHARYILFSDTPLGSELARRVAARLGDRAAFDVRRLARDGLVSDGDAGRSEVRRSLPRVLVLAQSSFKPIEGAGAREARLLDVPAAATDPRVRHRGFLPLDPAAVPLNEADLIISAGSGLTDWESFHAAAIELGAAEGGSRVVCDAGLLPRSRQVGASGLLVEPRCYLAFGIAGASQHLQGIAAAERVIAVNTDLRAEMIKRADLAIVADAQAVLPALVRRAVARRSGRASRSPLVGEGDSSWKRETDEAAFGLNRPLICPSGAPSPTSGEGERADVVVLVSLGFHPVSKRPRRADRDGRALELALTCGSAVAALHAGSPDASILRDYIGAGADDLIVLDNPSDADPLGVLESWLHTHRPRLVIAGARAEAGECSGMVPYVLAERLGFGLAANIVSIELAGDTAHLVQALPGGKRRALEAKLPLVVTVDRTGPDPRLSARMRGLRGSIDVRQRGALAPDERTQWVTKPSRPRPKRLIAPGLEQTAEAGRRTMIAPEPDDAADAILDFLERDGLLATGGKETQP